MWLNKFQKYFFTLFIFIVSYESKSQFEIGYFNAIQLGNKVKLTWEVKAGSTCNGMQMERSVDSLNYFFIDEVEGICGSGSSAQSFELYDESPLNYQTNYYKLIAGTGETFFASVLYSFVNEGSFFIQNPVNLSSTLFFEDNQNFVVNFYQINGQLITSQTVSVKAIPINQLLTEIPNTPFLLDVESKNGTHETIILVGNR